MIEIEVASLIPEAVLAKFQPAAMERLAEQLAGIARAAWINLAGEKLHKTSQDYSKAIQPVTSENGVSLVILTGVWPNMLERGFGPYDMRETLLGPNVPVVQHGEKGGKHVNKEGGFYRSIFFRMMSPTASGRNAQKVTDVYAQYLGAAEAQKLGKEAWRQLKKLDHKQRLAAGSVTSIKGRSHALDTYSIHAGTSKEIGYIRHGGAEHKTDLFAGAGKTGAKGHTITGTFRTISTSSTDGWIHPGYQPGANLAPKAAEAALKQLPMLIAQMDEGAQGNV